jgi:beta-N-acetylhexosaminidase
VKLHRISRLVGCGLALIALPLAGQTGSSRLDPLPPPSALDSAFVDRLLDSLPVRARVAQLIVPRVLGSYAAFDDSVFTVMQGWVDSLAVGGLIVSAGTPLDVAFKLNTLQRRSALPLLVASDLESGAGFRITGATAFPPNMGVAAAGSEQDAYEVGRITALEGRAVGIHLAFAPDADVNNNPDNPVINTRSFGSDAYQVSRMVRAAVRGLEDHGMLATAKHFPGHGDTSIDSHLSLPVIGAGWARLDSVELVPFRAAVDAGTAFVMSAHIVMPALSSLRGRPATLDPAVLTGVLRDSLGFRGLIVTDALDMAGIVNTYGAGEAAVLAFQAGADLLLQPEDPRSAITALTNAVETGRISFERLDRSVRRLLLLKHQLGLFHERTVPLDSVPTIVGSQRFLTSARDLAQRSITLVTDPRGTVDSLRARPGPLALITYGEENAGTVGATLQRQLRMSGYDPVLFRLWPASGAAGLDSARAVLKRQRYVIFAVSVKVTPGKGTIALPDPIARLIGATTRWHRVVLLSLGSPYLLAQVPERPSYLLAWSSNPLMEWAAARALAGQAPITGQLPVPLPDFPLGTGVIRGVPTR